jgi:hypothetical protein
MDEKCKTLEMERNNLQLQLRRVRTDPHKPDQSDANGSSLEQKANRRESTITMVDRGGAIEEADNENN